MRDAAFNHLRILAKKLKREGRFLPLVNAGQKAWQAKKDLVDRYYAKATTAELIRHPTAPIFAAL